VGPTLLDLAGFQTSAGGRGILLGEVGEREERERHGERDSRKLGEACIFIYMPE